MEMRKRWDWEQPNFTKWQVNKIYWAWKSGKIDVEPWLVNRLYGLAGSFTMFGDYYIENELVGFLMGALAKSEWGKAQSIVSDYTERIRKALVELYGKVY